MQILIYRDGHVTTFRHPSRPISAKCLVTDFPDQQKAHLQSLGFLSVPLVWVKLFPVGCAQDSLLYLAAPTLQNSGIFHDSTCPHLHCNGLPPKSRRSLICIQDLGPLGFELDRNAPERRSGSFFKNRNGVPVHFFLKIPNENQIAVVAYTQVCFHPWQF